VEGLSRGPLLHPQIQPPAWALIFGALVIVAACYANALPNGFILDDYHVVAVNPAVRAIDPLQVLTAPYWGETSDSGIYRPLTIFSFSLEYPLWGRWAGGYRLTNFLLHAINGLLVFAIAKGILGSVSAALAAGALYLAHPIHIEPVVGLIGRSELLAAMFLLLAWILFRENRIILCSIAFFFSLLSKENAIAFAGIVLLEAFISRKEGQNLHKLLFNLVPLSVSAFLYFGIRWWVLGALGVPKHAQYLDGTLTLVERELTSGRAFLKYFQLLIAPVNVTGDYDFNSIPTATIHDWVAWTGLVVVAATIGLALRLRKTHPEISFAILFFYVTMLPTSNWIIPTGIIMSERALYLPSLAVCLAAGMFWARIANRDLRRLLGAGVMVSAALLCTVHSYVWRDELTYFGNLVRVLPDNIRGRQGYGVALAEAGRPEAAREQFEAGLKIKRNAPLLVGLGGVLAQLDQGCSRARPVLQEALTIQPADPFARWLLGSCFEKEGLVREAEASYRQAVRDTSFPDPRLLTDWGRVLEKTGRPAEAQEAYRRAEKLK
jgi:tetratricopeptide (TPR) repeat protein